MTVNAHADAGARVVDSMVSVGRVLVLDDPPATEASSSGSI
jgi:hypothetical protein